MNLSESELRTIYLQETIKNKFNSLSTEDKGLFLEMFNALNSNQIITERQWYNTVGDIAGIVDPTGTIDLLNGLSYWRQGDFFSAILSWISVIPYVGDAIGKPVMAFLRADAKLLRTLNTAAKAKDAGKIAQLATTKGSWLLKFFKTISQWIGKLFKFLGKAFRRGTYKTIASEVDGTLKVFQDVGKKVNTPQQTVAPQIQQTAAPVKNDDSLNFLDDLFNF
jgi:hypothetical protein